MNAPPGINADWTQWPAPQAYLTWTDTTGATQWATFDVVVSEEWGEDAEVTEHPVEQGANVGDHVRVKLVTCKLKVFVSQEPIDASPFLGTAGSRSFAQDTPTRINLPAPSWVPASGVLIVPQWDNLIELRALGGALVGLTGALSGPGGQVAGLVGNVAAAALLGGIETETVVNTDAGLLPPGPAAPAFPVVQRYASATDFVRAMHDLLKSLKNSAQLLTLVGRKNVQANMAIDGLTFLSEDRTGTGEDVNISLREIRVVQTQQVAAPIPNLSAGGGKPPVNHGGQSATDAPVQTQSLAVKGIKAAVPAFKKLTSLFQ